jgi:hypothetical protein
MEEEEEAQYIKVISAEEKLMCPIKFHCLLVYLYSSNCV